MPTRSLLSFTGFIMLVAATYCPLLRPFGLMNWDLYDLNKPYGIVVLLMSVVGIAGVVLKQPRVARLAAYTALLLVILLYVAALLRIHHAFSFIPFKSVAGYLTRHIKFKWGWYLLFGGALLAVLGAVTTKRGRPAGNK